MTRPPATTVDLEACLTRFEHAWQTRPPAALHEFLPPSSRRPFLLDAIPIDLEYRWCRFSAGGDFLKASQELPGHPLLEDYVRRFPELGAAAGLPAELIGEEYRVRRWAGQALAHADYTRRFPAQAATLVRVLEGIDRELARRPASVEASESSADASVEVPLQSLTAFFSQLEEHPFLAKEQVRELRTLASRDIAALAAETVRRGWLTAFQADFLVRGKGSSLVVGPYVLLDRIGSGWSSQVFRARHVPLDRIVALKLFRRELLQGMDDAVLRRFYQEMQAVGRLSHPNVVHAYDAGPIGATLFLAMEYLAGSDLQRRVQDRGPLGVDEAVEYVYQAALGLQHAFEHGLVHRDVKPSNLLVVPGAGFGTVKVLDLGLARLHQAVRDGSGSALTRTGWMMGTADFMAPEQGFDPHNVDIRADLYSLGCTFFYLLAGRPPFPGGSFLQKLNRHRDATPPTLASIRADVPQEVSAVVSRLLRKRPEERWATPAELANALDAHGRRAGMGAPPVSGRRLARRAAIAGGIGTALAVAAGVSVVVWRSRAGNRDQDARATRPGEGPTPDLPGRRALRFDGAADFIPLHDSLIAGSQELTLELRFKTQTGGVLWGYQQEPCPQPSGEHVSLLYVGTDGRLHGDVWGGGHVRLASTARVNDQRWHHAALCVGQGRVSLYVDGALVESKDGNINHLRMAKNQLGTGLTGDHPAGNNSWFAFAGLMNEVRAWHLVRSAEQVKRFANRKLAGAEAGLVAYYPADEASGNTLVDQSGNRRDVGVKVKRVLDEGR